MPIKPIDIRRKEFRNGFRGYDANQVDDFLDAVADEFERSYMENQRMREEVSSLRDRLQQFEDLEGSIRAALVHAEQAANDLRRAANREAEDVRQGARREAEFTIREAQSRSHQMLADSSARIERVQESYEALQEAKRSFANDFRHLLKTHLDMMENMEVSSAQEIESSLRQRLDTESIAVVHQAAQEEARISEGSTADEGETAEAGATRAGQTLSGHQIVESEEEPAPAAEADEAVMEDPGATQRIEPETAGVYQASSGESTADSPTEVLRPEDAQSEGPLSEEPPVEETAAEEPRAESQEPEVAEPEVEPSTAQGETAQEPVDSEPGAAGEVEREEPSLAEESSSHEFLDREEQSQDRGDSRIFRASRFLRRRE